MKRAWFDAPADVFAKLKPMTILGGLSLSPFADEPAQKSAWQFEVEHLQPIAAMLPNAHIFLEFGIPRMGRRADAVIVSGSLIFVLEYKVGKRDFPIHAREQVHGYGFDLKVFHQTSRDKTIVPILISSKAPTQSIELGFAHKDGVLEPINCSPRDVLPTLKRFIAMDTEPAIDPVTWAAGSYAPTPTIIEAAEALYAGHDVADISRHEAGRENLARTSTAIESIGNQMKGAGQKAICFVTGVPGAGKTLAGLNIAAGRLKNDIGEDSALLSGNGPLVEVLATALTRDFRDRAKRRGLKKDQLHLLGRAPDKLIQAAHRFRSDYLKDSGPPPEHVIIFDEAQRAWGRTKATRYMAGKGHHDFD